jgi:hypothetical protein
VHRPGPRRLPVRREHLRRTAARHRPGVGDPLLVPDRDPRAARRGRPGPQGRHQQHDGYDGDGGRDCRVVRRRLCLDRVPYRLLVGAGVLVGVAVS